MPWVGGGMAVASVAGGMMAQSAAKDAAGQAGASRAQAQEDINRAVEEIKKLGIPEIEAQKIVLQKPELVGLLSAQNLGPSAMEQVSAPQNLVSAQLSALQGLKERSEQGMTPQDRLQLMNIQNSLSAQNQANNKGIMQSFAERGQAGSGNELAMRLISGQNQNQIAGQQGMALAAQIADAKRAALGDYGNMAGSVRAQDVADQTRIAQARDEINRFNTMNTQQVAAQNLANRQMIANQGVATANQQEQYNKGLIGQQYGQQVQKTQLLGNALTGQASNFNTQASQQLQAGQNAAQGWQNIGTGVSNGLAAYGKYKMGSKSLATDPDGYSTTNSNNYYDDGTKS
jgi:hypothetical protein